MTWFLTMIAFVIFWIIFVQFIVVWTTKLSKYILNIKFSGWVKPYSESKCNQPTRIKSKIWKSEQLSTMYGWVCLKIKWLISNGLRKHCWMEICRSNLKIRFVNLWKKLLSMEYMLASICRNWLAVDLIKLFGIKNFMIWWNWTEPSSRIW